MNKHRIIFINLAIISASVICFEIISTRISSVIFVQNYAFMILSLAVLGLGSGGIFSYYKIKNENKTDSLHKTLSNTILLTALSLGLFICGVVFFNISNPIVYFLFQYFPFFFAGIVYAQLFKIYAEHSFKLYAADLIGAAVGSILPLGLLLLFNAVNFVFIIIIILLSSALSLSNIITRSKIILYTSLFACLVVLVLNSDKNFIGEIPIGNFPEKDFYYVYPDLDVQANIVDTRWSVNGRSDLVEYSHQNVVKQLFIDGSAGSPMYKFNGSITNPGALLNGLLVQHSTTVPFLFFNKDYKKDMLVIGPGGGKDILIGLLSGVQNITGVEVNPDFVNIVKKYKDFDGGIYNAFPGVNIIVDEGRHFVKKTKKEYNIILMALPSTEQLQSIDNFASNENYLLTVEALKDYLNILKTDGSIVLTVHNRWELVRLIVTALYAFNEIGINNYDALNHFIIIGEEYAPTVVIKKNIFTKVEVDAIKSTMSKFTVAVPQITYLPYNWETNENSVENILLRLIHERQTSLPEYITKDKYDISPVRDNSPYFYKVNRGLPTDLVELLLAVGVLALGFIVVPTLRIKKDRNKDREKHIVVIMLLLFASLGLGFMIIEISLFQKVILFLGSPTISLSVLLGTLLIGMGTGSLCAGTFFKGDNKTNLRITPFIIVALGIVLLIALPFVLDKLLVQSKLVISLVCFIAMLPFGFFLGIPFSSCIRLLKDYKMENYIPWMYGVNGIMSVLGSVLAVALSMLLGFTETFIIGLCCYLVVYFAITSKKLTSNK